MKFTQKDVIFMFTHEDGFTLVEILVSIVLIGIIAIYILPVFGQIFSSIFSSGDKTDITYIGQREIINSIKNLNTNSEINDIDNITITPGATSIYTINVATSPVELIIEKRTITGQYQNPAKKTSTNPVILDYYLYNSSP